MGVSVVLSKDGSADWAFARPNCNAAKLVPASKLKMRLFILISPLFDFIQNRITQPPLEQRDFQWLIYIKLKFRNDTSQALLFPSYDWLERRSGILQYSMII
jgi:hypothetical protein